VKLFVKDRFTGWHQTALAVLSKLFDAAKKSFPDDTHAQVLAALAADPEAAASVQVDVNDSSQPRAARLLTWHSVGC